MNTLRPLVAFLRTLPLPTTHPTHPAAPAILSTLKDAQRGYADMRGNWTRKCLETQGKRVVDRADTIDTIAAGKDFGTWVESLLSVAEVRVLNALFKNPANSFNMKEEYNLLTDLSPLNSPALIASAYNTLLNPILALFSSTLTSLIALIKRSLHKFTFLALSSYESLLSLQPRWDNLLSRRKGPTADPRKDTNELRDGLNTLRAVCLRSFPEFLADLKLSTMGRSGEMSTGLAEFTVSVKCPLFLGIHAHLPWRIDDHLHGPTSRSAERRRFGLANAWRW